MIENLNTKREIKDSSAYTRSMMSKIKSNEAYKHMREQKISKERTASIKAIECQTEVAEGGTREITEEITTLEEDDRRVKCEHIREVSNYDDFSRIRDYDWPVEIYKTSKHEEGLVIRAPKDSDLVVWDEGDAAGEQTKRAMSRYVELRDLEGETASLYPTTKSENAQGRLWATE